MASEREAAKSDTRKYAQTGGPKNWNPSPVRKPEPLFGNHIRWAWSVIREAWRRRRG